MRERASKRERGRKEGGWVEVERKEREREKERKEARRERKKERPSPREVR